MANQPKYRFFKLGRNASVFFDSVTRLKVTPNRPGFIRRRNVTPRIEQALSSRHLEEISEDQYNKLMENGSSEEAESDQNSPEDEIDISEHQLWDYNNEGLMELAEENLEDDEELKDFKKLNKEKRIRFLVARGIEGAEESEE